MSILHVYLAVLICLIFAASPTLASTDEAIRAPARIPSLCQGTFGSANPIVTGAPVKISDYLRPQAGSFALRNPETFEAIIRLYRTVPTYKSLFGKSAHLPTDMTADQILQQYVDGLHEIAQQIKRSVSTLDLKTGHYENDRLKLTRFADYLNSFYFGQSENARWFHHVAYKRTQELMDEGRDYSLAGLSTKTRHEILAKLSGLASSWMELLFGFSVPNLKATQIHIESLGNIDPRLSSAHLDRKLSMREIDIFWMADENHFAFGEVKISRHELEVGSEEFERAYDQVLSQLQIVNSLPTDNHLSTSLHLFFIPSMTRAAKAEFEKIGVVVHTLEPESLRMRVLPR